ncbi:TPA: hypothetical protein VB504_001405 [Streptococcus pyogenes]|uniref:SpoV family signaling peptide n=1 Tax=Streptococcus pyogenes TaxID=1314 RepID=UPI00109D4B58|nr:SpoV family signaling peptide [Streptococcus pyogenes]HER4541148.1 hypothetical protein [Streptococcus pyogenes NGAS719]VGQ72666.1 Uncharacterised protein [Streptococcus pyogenes]VGU27908.1 Uncharacterised protein [Streptococcus pyogenes]VHB99985.1 Uncharacterised protein [Streptococcus pyogenes]VHC36605.1 Uncharacterised protein [Streptococcus pyogenes]
MKNKLFLVALATVTVLGPSLATPHHRTVHATSVSPAGTCIYPKEDSTISVCYENVLEDSPEEVNASQSSGIISLLNQLWTKIKTWFSSLIMN